MGRPTIDVTAVMTRTFSLLVSSWGGHKLSSCFLSSSICRACSVSLVSSVSTTTLPTRLKIRKWSTLLTAATMIVSSASMNRFLPFVGMPLTSFSEDINRRSNPLSKHSIQSQMARAWGTRRSRLASSRNLCQEMPDSGP